MRYKCIVNGNKIVFVEIKGMLKFWDFFSFVVFLILDYFCYFFIVVLYFNFCVIDNGGCLSLCLLNFKSYFCLCLDGFFFVKIGNVIKCEGEVIKI